MHILPLSPLLPHWLTLFHNDCFCRCDLSITSSAGEIPHSTAIHVWYPDGLAGEDVNSMIGRSVESISGFWLWIRFSGFHNTLRSQFIPFPVNLQEFGMKNIAWIVIVFFLILTSPLTFSLPLLHPHPSLRQIILSDLLSQWTLCSVTEVIIAAGFSYSLHIPWFEPKSPFNES